MRLKTLAAAALLAFAGTAIAAEDSPVSITVTTTTAHSCSRLHRASST